MPVFLLFMELTGYPLIMYSSIAFPCIQDQDVSWASSRGLFGQMRTSSLRIHEGGLHCIALPCIDLRCLVACAGCRSIVRLLEAKQLQLNREEFRSAISCLN